VIVASLLLILVAVTLLVFGLASGSSVLLVCSIAVSLLAAVALVVGARQAAAARAGTGYGDDERVRRVGDEDDLRVQHHRSTARANEPGRRRAAAWGAGDSPVAVAEPVQATVPGQGTYRSAAADDLGRSEPVSPAYGGAGGLADADDDEELPDEPAAQYVSAADAARVAQMSTDVLVIDGRPRYHVAGCVHLLGRESEPLPVGEAVELGFTPCSLCEPDSALLAGARRV
jgi:hypothetical protein